MRRVIALAALVAVMAFASPGVSLAQRGMGGGYARLYDLQTVATVSGKVVSVDTVARRSGRFYGIHLVVKTADGDMSVHLGPGWFLSQKGMKIAPGDEVEVTGSRVTYDGKPALIAAEVRKGSESLVLRDSKGFPLWSRWHQR